MRLLQDFVLRNDRRGTLLVMIRMVTNWSQRGEMGEGAKRLEAETLSNKRIAGAPGRTRTRGPRFRKPLLYPPELQAHLW